MATSAQVQQLNIVYFGRPADPTGLAYWTTDTTTPLATIADGFATTPEFQSTILGKSFAQIVNQFYVSLFGRSAEAAGINYWVELLSTGRTTIQEVGLNISNAALRLPDTNADNIALTSKLTASANYTAQVDTSTAGILAYAGQPGIDAGIAFLDPVLTVATIPDAAATTAAVNNLIASNSGVGQTVDLSSFIDVFTATNAVRLTPAGDVVETLPFRFTSASQSVSATTGTVQARDELLDPSTLDSDNFNITVTPGFDFQLLEGLATTNIENFKFFLNGATGGETFDFTADSAKVNVKSVVVSGTIAGAGGFTVDNFGDAGATSFDASGVTTGGAAGQIIARAYAAPAITGASVTITGGAGNDVLEGGGAADTIYGNAGNDRIVGFAGNDNLSGGDGNDTIVGGDGNDTIVGGNNIDLIFGDAGNDTITGDAGNDTIEGGAGNDTITGGTGADRLVGDAGSDVFNYGSLTQLVLDTGDNAARSDTIVNFDTGVDTIQTGLAGTATNFADVGGNDYADAKQEAETVFDGVVQYAYSDFGVLFVDTNKDGIADASIISAGLIASADIVA